MFKQIRRLMVAATLAATVGVPSVASARFAPEPIVGSGAPPVTVVSTPPAPTTSSPGFQWGDAGLGALGVLVLGGAATGAAFLVRRRAHHPLAG